MLRQRHQHQHQHQQPCRRRRRRPSPVAEAALAVLVLLLPSSLLAAAFVGPVRGPEPSNYNSRHRHPQPHLRQHPVWGTLFQTLNNDGGDGGGSSSSSGGGMSSNANWGRGDFDPDPLEQDAGGVPPPPADMLARIFQGAQQRRASSGEGGDWARYASALQGGVVLVANPAVFLNNPPDELARRFFLPTDLSLEMLGGLGATAVDNLANVLPVVLLLGSGPSGTTGLVLNRRTGYLVGDLNVDSSGFKVQPVHLGGMAEGEGIFMLHTYPDLPKSQQVTVDGLCFGGNYTAAQELVRESKATSSRFKFFIQRTEWAPGQLRQEVEDMKVWYPAQVSKDILLRNRGREGPKMVKPLWTEVMELMGGRFLDIKRELYGDDDDDDEDSGDGNGDGKNTGRQ